MHLSIPRLYCSIVVLLLPGAASAAEDLRGTGDLGVVIERAAGQLKVISTSERAALATVPGLGDLSHASVVFSRDGRFAFVFGRDGGLTKVDLLTASIVNRVLQSGNSIGGAISQDGTLIAVSNYEPGGVRVFDSETLKLVADIPADHGGVLSKVVGLVDAPGNRFVFSLFDAGQIWIADFAAAERPQLHKFPAVGKQPYDALLTPDGRYYIAGLFGEDGFALVDLWHLDKGVRRILGDYGRGEEKMPVYKMPHLEGWAIANQAAFVPAIGRHEVLVINTDDWAPRAAIAVHGQPVFVMAQPDGRHVWVNYAFPNNGVVQIIDTETLTIAHTLSPGKAILHMEFTPRGEHVWISARDDDRVLVYDTRTLENIATLAADKPSGIFFTARANRIGL
ncbi:MAG TPA: cytochrome D1 domain-containing protein [Gammaproteobacteria bacterium]|nr:cytochrome D1 domain-containing protein [Gammaproteobacteria bacterium]